jgi:hypothetical protein
LVTGLDAFGAPASPMVVALVTAVGVGEVGVEVPVAPASATPEVARTAAVVAVVMTVRSFMSSVSARIVSGV